MTNMEGNQRGGMSWGNRLFMIFWTAITVIMIAIAVMMYVSLVPHFFLIGWIMLVTVTVLLACGVGLIVTFTISQASIWWNRRNLIVHGEVVAWLRPDGSFEHLSAQHMAAGLLPQRAMSQEDEDEEKEAPLPSDDATVIDMYRHGSTLQTIVEFTHRSYYQVQKVVAKAKKDKLLS